MYFTASYGLTRQQLEQANFLLKNSDHIEIDKNDIQAPVRKSLTPIEASLTRRHRMPLISLTTSRFALL